MPLLAVNYRIVTVIAWQWSIMMSKVVPSSPVVQSMHLVQSSE